MDPGGPFRGPIQPPSSATQLVAWAILGTSGRRLRFVVRRLWSSFSASISSGASSIVAGSSGFVRESYLSRSMRVATAARIVAHAMIAFSAWSCASSTLHCPCFQCQTVLRGLAERWQQLDREVDALDEQFENLAKKNAPDLLALRRGLRRCCVHAPHRRRRQSSASHARGLLRGALRRIAD